jgi:CheY-like chemotaxis protein
MLALIRQTAKDFRENVLNHITQMLIQPIVFDKPGKEKKGITYSWVPDDVETTVSYQQSTSPSKFNSEVYSPKTLHVEDNAEIRSIVKYFLKKNFDLKFAPTGEVALDLVQSTQFDVIIMDINLGEGIDGIETARMIRELDSYKNVPIIAITANLSSNVRDNCINVGMDAFLPKPFRREDLVNTINFVLERRTTL